MKAYSLRVIFICCVCEYTSVDIMPDLKSNILNFGYRINFKMRECYHTPLIDFMQSLKFILPTIKDLKVLAMKFDSS